MLALRTLQRFPCASSSASGSSQLRTFADVAVKRLVRGTNITLEERAALRAARKDRAVRAFEQQKAEGGGGTSGATGLGGSASSTPSGATPRTLPKYFWYLSVSVPAALLVWGYNDENSPPAKVSKMIGLTDFIRPFADEIAKPSHNKLLPDWSQVCK
jgi:hypothetical protein